MYILILTVSVFVLNKLNELISYWNVVYIKILSEVYVSCF